MKNLVFGLLAVAFVGLSSFTSVSEEEVLLHNCTYKMYSASGKYLGNWTLSDVPDNVSCGSSTAKHYAVESYNAYHEMF